MHLVKKILFPFSLVYALVVHIRNYCYDKEVLKSRSFKTPTICVGNLSVGGTGKTPMVEYLISLLKGDYRLAVLSRGYRRKSKGYLMATPTTSVEELGDEPGQIHAKFPEIIVAVDADRQNGITMLQNRAQPEVILLDDAFQHRKVKSGFSILLTTYGNIYINDWYLPSGTLRDSKREAKRADLIVVTKCPDTLSDAQRREIVQKIQPQTHQEIIFSFLEYDLKLKGTMNDLSIDRLANKNITLVTGIANPEPLVTYLKEKGISIEHLRFRDHHFFSQSELDLLRKKECIITTEKDYVRLKNKLENLSYISMKHRFSPGDHKLLESRVRAFMRTNS